MLGRSTFGRYVTANERGRFLTAFLRRAERVEVSQPVVACRDHKANKFLSLAVAGSASVIVSGDLFALDPFRGIPTLRPQDFPAAVVEE